MSDKSKRLKKRVLNKLNKNDLSSKFVTNKGKRYLYIRNPLGHIVTRIRGNTYKSLDKLDIKQVPHLTDKNIIFTGKNIGRKIPVYSITNRFAPRSTGIEKGKIPTDINFPDPKPEKYKISRSKNSKFLTETWQFSDGKRTISVRARSLSQTINNKKDLVKARLSVYNNAFRRGQAKLKVNSKSITAIKRKSSTITEYKGVKIPTRVK